MEDWLHKPGLIWIDQTVLLHPAAFSSKSSGRQLLVPNCSQDRELYHEWKYTEKCCHDFCLSLFSFLLEPPLTPNMITIFLKPTLLLPDYTLIGFVTSAKSPAKWCHTSFDLVIHFSWISFFHSLIHYTSRKTYSNFRESWKPHCQCLTHIQYSVACLVPSLTKFFKGGINSWNENNKQQRIETLN